MRSNLWKPFNNYKEVKLSVSKNNSKYVFSVQECNFDTAYRECTLESMIEIKCLSKNLTGLFSEHSKYKELVLGYIVYVRDGKVSNAYIQTVSSIYGETDRIVDKVELEFISNILNSSGVLKHNLQLKMNSSKSA